MRNMALSYSITYTPRAVRELSEIREYITENFYAPDIANKQVERIVKTIKTLAIFPKRYKIRSQQSGMRLCPVDNYAVLYSIDDENKTVNISRIIYARRDFDRLI